MSVHCPVCASDNLMRVGYSEANRIRWKCRICGRKFVGEYVTSAERAERARTKEPTVNLQLASVRLSTGLVDLLGWIEGNRIECFTDENKIGMRLSPSGLPLFSDPTPEYRRLYLHSSEIANIVRNFFRIHHDTYTTLLARPGKNQFTMELFGKTKLKSVFDKDDPKPCYISVRANYVCAFSKGLRELMDLDEGDTVQLARDGRKLFLTHGDEEDFTLHAGNVTDRVFSEYVLDFFGDVGGVEVQKYWIKQTPTRKKNDPRHYYRLIKQK